MKEFYECPHCGFFSFEDQAPGREVCPSCGKTRANASVFKRSARKFWQVLSLSRILLALFYARYFLLAAVSVFIVYNYYIYTPRDRAEPVRAVLDPPSQSLILSPVVLNKGEVRIAKVAEFSVEARVLSLAWRLPINDFARLSPMDIALGWGFMAETGNASVIKIHHVPIARQLLWTVSWAGGGAGLINAHVANVHIIPADDVVAGRLRQVRVGDIVDMSGNLVDIAFPDGSQIATSLSRFDTGDGACEVLWLEKLDIL